MDIGLIEGAFRKGSDRLTVRLKQIGPDAHQALAKALRPIAHAMMNEARARAEAHIRFYGFAPGKYVQSIQGGVSDTSPTRVTGYVRSASPLAHLMELGANLPARDIEARLKQVLASPEEIYGRLVRFPGATMPAYPAIFPTMEAHRAEITATLASAVNTAAANA